MVTRLPLRGAFIFAFFLFQDVVAANVTKLTPQFFPKYNSKRVQIKYGPFTVPSMMEDDGMRSFVRESIEGPCTDCVITWMQAGLEYPNGTTANADTGMWLHHTVLANTNRGSTVCPSDQSVDQFFASGNERTPINICANGTDKAGYYLGPNANIALLVELMNMAMEARDAVLTVSYEYVSTAPKDFSRVEVLWLDIGGCSGSSDQPAKRNTTFSYTSPVWKSVSTRGKITFVGAHLHDGGTHLVVRKNGQPICDCKASYGQTPGYIDGPTVMEMPGNADTIHISNISTCSNDGNVHIGDTMSITAHYNTSEYSPMTNMDGSLAPIMGIALVYVAPGLGGVKAARAVSSASATMDMSTMTMSMSMSMSMSRAMTSTTVAASAATATSTGGAAAGGHAIASSLWSLLVPAALVALLPQAAAAEMI